MKAQHLNRIKNGYSLKSITSALVLVFSIMASINVYAQKNLNSANSKILVIASHPFPEKSVINKALQESVKDMDNVIYRNLETLYGNDITAIDIEAERKAYEGVDKVVYMFPIHWFNLTPMLKAYFNSVWYQWAPKNLQGKKMLVVITAGATEKDYSHDGKIGVTVDEMLSPMKACANYVGMIYLQPQAFLGVTGADEAKLQSYQKQLIERLNQEN